MADPIETYRLILGLVRMNDLDVLPQVTGSHPDQYRSSDLSVYMQIGRDLQSLVSSYDFTDSAEFQRSVRGKASAYVAMKKKLESDPVKRKQHRDRFFAALRDLPISNDADLLVPESQQPLLDRLRHLVRELGR
jgi:hypothetical protein